MEITWGIKVRVRPFNVPTSSVPLSACAAIHSSCVLRCRVSTSTTSEIYIKKNTNLIGIETN